MEIIMRKIRSSDDDLKKIMQWRMKPSVAQYMYTDPKLTLGGQREWLERINNNRACRYWIISAEKHDIGVIAITDINEKSCELAWYIGEDAYRGKGIGKQLLLNLFQFVFVQLNLEEIYCEAMTINHVAINVYKKCGFETVELKDKYVCKNGKTYDVEIMRLDREKWMIDKKLHTFENSSFEE